MGGGGRCRVFSDGHGNWHHWLLFHRCE
jgi:hypothetical protein